MARFIIDKQFWVLDMSSSLTRFAFLYDQNMDRNQTTLKADINSKRTYANFHYGKERFLIRLIFLFLMT